MKSILLAAMTASVIVVTACGGGGSAKAGAGDIAKACEEATNMGPALCDCVSRKAVEELTGDGQALLLAMLEEDQDAADAARRKMEAEEIVAAGTFMTRAPAACAREGAAQ